MKPLLLSAIALSLTLTGIAQLNTMPAAAFYETAALMMATNNCGAALDALQLSPDNQRNEFLEAQALYGRACNQAAVLAYSRFCARYPFSPLRPYALAGKADCLYALEEYEGALEAYAAVPREQLTPYYAAGTLFKEGIAAAACHRYDMAADALERAAKSSTFRNDALFALGVIAFDRGDFDTAAKYFDRVNTDRAPGNRVPYYLACIDFARSQWDKALKAARSILNKPVKGLDTNEMNRIAGESLCRIGDNAEGLEYLRQYIKNASEPVPSAQYLVGVDEYDNGNYDTARQYLEDVAETTEGELQQAAYLYLGQCLIHSGDKDAAILAFDKAVRLDYDNDITQTAFYNYTVASACGAAVPFASSVKLYEDFLSRYPDGIFTQRVAGRLAEAFLAEKDYQSVISSTRHIKSPSPELLAASKQALYSMARQALADGNTLRADSLINQCRTIASNTAQLNSEIALLQAQLRASQGMHKEAQQLYARYVNSAGNNSPNLAPAIYGLAYSSYQLAQTERAASEFKRALTVTDSRPVRADILCRLADISFAGNDFTAAADLYMEAFKAYPDGGDYAMLGRAKMLGYNRRYSDKLRQLGEFERLFPSSALMPEVLLETAQAQISLVRNTDAVETYRRVIDLYPTTAACRRAWLQLGMTLLDMKQRDEAIAAYRSLIEQYPRSDEAAHAAGLLKNIYAEEGRAAEYLAFISSVADAPQPDANQTEKLSYQSALNQYQRSGNRAPLRDFIDTYPRSEHAAEALAVLLDSSSDPNETETLARIAIENYRGTRAAEMGMTQRAEALYAAGDMPRALAAWRELADSSSDPARTTLARLGIMRAARDMDSLELAMRYADILISSSPAGSYADEARYTKAQVLDAQGNTDAAVDIWLALVDNNKNIYGAKSSVAAAQALFDKGDDSKALDTVRCLVQSGSPHHYWVARGFILLSDIYSKQGKNFEAREYLEALANNYPGNESDIRLMIESRLNP